MRTIVYQTLMNFSFRLIAALALFVLAGAFFLWFSFGKEGHTSYVKDRLDQFALSRVTGNPALLSKALEEDRAMKAEQQKTEQTFSVKLNHNRIFKNENDAHIGHGPIKIVEFIDYDCPSCQTGGQILHQLINEGKITLIIKDYPQLGEGARQKARAAQAVLQNYPSRFKTFHFTLLKARSGSAQKDIEKATKAAGLDMTRINLLIQNQNVDEKLTEDGALGDQLYIRGTPTFIVGHEAIEGIASKPEFYNRIRTAVAGVEQ